MSITTNGGLVIDLVDHPSADAGDADGAILEKIFSAAQPGAVFGAPVASGTFTVVTASEVSAGGGFGWSRTAPLRLFGKQPAAEPPSSERGGSGGGGGASGRPIAAIVIGPDGVTVKPIVDVTKIVMATIATLGTTKAMFLKLRARAR
jgi:uncharacterized spore protein YtfJ